MTGLTLELDVGNSRIKWRLQDATSHPAQVRSGVVETPVALLRGLQGPVGRIRVASVRGATFNAQLAADLQQQLGVIPEFALPSPQQAGVTCGYVEPARLGVDRWLAVLAAWQRAPGALIVVSAGTAMTLDLVDHLGQHLGGYIVPGLSLQQRALGQHTAEVQVGQAPPPQLPDLTPGRTTAEGVQRGALLMLLQLIRGQYAQFSAQEAAAQRPAPTLFICGGDAERLLPHLPPSVLHSPELVLDGLVLALP